MRAAQIFESSTPIRIRQPRNLHFGRVLAVAVLAGTGFGAYHLVSANGSGSPAIAASTTPPAATAQATVTPTVTVTATPTATQTPTPAAPKNEAVIKLTANSDCWVGINSTTGKLLYQGIIPAGQTKTWNEKQKVSMVIGNPPGITLTVNGQSEKLNPVGVATLHIDPTSKTPVSGG